MPTLPLFSPKRCIIEVSENCNLRCQTCLRWRTGQSQQRKGPNDALASSRIKDLQRDLAKTAVRQVTYLGGEPFLREDLVELACCAKQAGLSTAVVTNGTLSEESKIVEFVEKEAFDFLIFSIDGPAALHDAIRGMKGAYQRAAGAVMTTQKLKKARKAKRPRIYMYATISALNCEYLEDIFQVARRLDAAVLKFISMSCVDSAIIDKTNSLFDSPAVRSHSYAVSRRLCIPAAKRQPLKEKLAQLTAQGKKIGLEIWAEEALLNGRGATACAFLGRDFVISASGDVFICPMLPDYVLGSVKDGSLNELFESAAAENQAQKLRRMSGHRTLPICAECCVEKLSFPA